LHATGGNTIRCNQCGTTLSLPRVSSFAEFEAPKRISRARAKPKAKDEQGQFIPGAMHPTRVGKKPARMLEKNRTNLHFMRMAMSLTGRSAARIGSVVRALDRSFSNAKGARPNRSGGISARCSLSRVLPKPDETVCPGKTVGEGLVEQEKGEAGNATKSN
jgi:hypothetical protein